MFAIKDRSRSARPRGRFRPGLAAAELAICMPFLLIFAFGSIEVTNAIFLKQRLKIAAYEGVRTATCPGQTTAGATTAANAVLTQFGITGGTVTVSPAVTSATATNTQITVTVSCPYASNLCVQSLVTTNVLSSMTAKAVMNHQ